MLTVATVLRAGPEYGVDYVEHLRDGVAAHLERPHRFVCLSDVEVPCERVPLVTDWPGWLAKLELFRPGALEAGGDVLYLDLDTIITGPLDPIAAHAHRFSMLSDFYTPDRPASGVMAWSGDYGQIFTRFSDRLVDKYRHFAPNGGDGGWIAANLGHEPERLQALFPGAIRSYKADRIAACGVPAGTSIVCFHGRPRPREVAWNLSRSSERGRA